MNIRFNQSLEFLLSFVMATSMAGNLLAQSESPSVEGDGAEVSLEPIETLRRQIAEAETVGNSFATNLGELNYDLGTQLAELGRHSDALLAFQKADQNLKIREGLYAEVREAPIRKIYEEHLQLRDWESAESALKTVAWLRERNFDELSLENVAVLQELVSWNLAIYYFDVGDDRERASALREAHRDLERIYAIYSANGLTLDQKTTELAMAVNQQLALYLVIDDFFTPRGIESFALENQLRRQIRAVEGACNDRYSENLEQMNSCTRAAEKQLRLRAPETGSLLTDSPNLNAPAPVMFARSRFYSSLNSNSIFANSSMNLEYDPDQIFYSRSYYRGLELLEDQVELAMASGDPVVALAAQLNLGDWYLLFSDDRNAEKIYVDAYLYAEQENLAETIYLKPPQPIAIAGVLPNMPELSMANQQGMANLELTIAANGEVEKIQVLDSSIADETILAELASEVATFRYRPSLREGIPVATVAYTMVENINY